MAILDDYIAFVKKQADYQERRVLNTRDNPKKNLFHVETANQFRALAGYLENLPSDSSPRTQHKTETNATAPLLPKELVGLPQELIDQLSAKGTDSQELEIIEIIDEAGGTLSLDRILIGIYKKSGQIIERSKLTAKLYRMVQKEMIYNVPKKKGIYTTDENIGLNNPTTESEGDES